MNNQMPPLPNDPQSNQPSPTPINPYAAPSNYSMGYDENNAYGDNHFGLLPEPRSCDAGRGMTWLTEAVKIIQNNFLLWIVFGVVLFIIFGLLSLIPLALNLLIFHFIAGIMYACAQQVEMGDIEFGDFFSAFQTHLQPLLILGVLYSVATLLMMIPVFVIAMFGAFAGGSDAMSLIVILGILFTLLLFVPLAMAIWLAPPLIVLNDVSPVDAVKMSFQGCLKNIVPFLIFGLVIMVAMPFAIIFTLGLALLIIIPLMSITNYTAYRDIWSGKMIDEA